MERFKTATFWKGLADRYLTVFVGALIAAALAQEPTSFFAIDWLKALDVTLLATVLPLVKDAVSHRQTDTAIATGGPKPYGNVTEEQASETGARAESYIEKLIAEREAVDAKLDAEIYEPKH